MLPEIYQSENGPAMKISRKLILSRGVITIFITREVVNHFSDSYFLILFDVPTNHTSLKTHSYYQYFKISLLSVANPLRKLNSEPLMLETTYS